MAMTIEWFEDTTTGKHQGVKSSGGITVAEVLFAEEGEAEGSLGAFARLFARANGLTDLPPPSPEGWFYIATLEAPGVWCRPVGPFANATDARSACTDAWKAANHG